MDKVAVIGSGFAGISAACFLAKEGLKVTVFEKNDSPGGRARKFKVNGFTFDMGPSWYWMPDVFESFFNHFDKSVCDYYELTRLSPSYQIFYSKHEVLTVPASVPELCQLFDSIEHRSSANLLKFLDEARDKYEIGIKELIYKPKLALSELLNKNLFKKLFKLHVFQTHSHYIRKYFKDQRLIQLLEFPVLFLGAPSSKIPALYSLMNYADMGLGTWYPKGGMNKIIDAMVALATSLGVQFEYGASVRQIVVKNKKAEGLVVNNQERKCDFVVAGADYHHVEQELLPLKNKKYSEAYWHRRTLAPSSLIFYLGINKKLKNLLHHNLFFDQNFQTHISEIYEKPSWPTNPLFYVCCSSISDETVAPAGHENVFILIPVAPALKDDPSTRQRYFNMVIDRLEYLTDQKIRDHIVFERSFAHNDFINDYNSFKGNAYGLANTLSQTANFKPSIRNDKVKNLFYAGQLTVPGPGVPPSIISGQLAARELLQQYRTIKS